MATFAPDGFEGGRPYAGGASCYRVGGASADGLPIVLLPGIEGDARIFYRMSALADRRPVLAMDLPREGDGLAAMAGRVLARLDGAFGPSADRQRFAVVGLSLGGLVGWAMAAAAPARVAALVTLGTLPGRALCPPAIARGRALSRALPGPLFSALYRARIGRRMAEEGVEPWLTSVLVGDLPGRDLVLRRLDAVLAWGLPGAVGVPALWLAGQDDREAPWGAADVARVLPDAAFATVPGGHRAPATHADSFRAAVSGFLEGRR